MCIYNNSVVIIVKFIFIRSFLFCCLLSNHSFQTNPNTVTNLSKLFNYTAQCVAFLGHYDCGAVKASTEVQDLGLVENWISNIRDVYRLHFDELDALSDVDDDAKHKRLVELNVVEQCLNLYKTGVCFKNSKIEN